MGRIKNKIKDNNGEDANERTDDDDGSAMKERRSCMCVWCVWVRYEWAHVEIYRDRTRNVIPNKKNIQISVQTDLNNTTVDSVVKRKKIWWEKLTSDRRYTAHSPSSCVICTEWKAAAVKRMGGNVITPSVLQLNKFLCGPKDNDQVNQTNTLVTMAHGTRTCTVSVRRVRLALSHTHPLQPLPHGVLLILHIAFDRRAATPTRTIARKHAAVLQSTYRRDDWRLLPRARRQCTDSIKTLIFTFVSRDAFNEMTARNRKKEKWKTKTTTSAVTKNAKKIFRFCYLHFIERKNHVVDLSRCER